MAINKEAKVLGVTWEQEYNCSQAVKVGDTIYLSGQVSHDEKAGSQIRGWLLWAARITKCSSPPASACLLYVGQHGGQLLTALGVIRLNAALK